MEAVKRVVIVAGCESYRTQDFVEAAEVLRCDVTVASDAESPASGGAAFLRVDLDDAAAAAQAIASAVPDAAAVVAVDDAGVAAAAMAAATLGLAHSPVEAVLASRDKLEMRRRLDSAGVVQPRFAPARPGEVAGVAAGIGFPVVVKPTGLSASRGVIRADRPDTAAAAEIRVRRIVADAGGDPDAPLLVEEYVPGVEVAVEGMLAGGGMETLAVIDKPGSLTGPYFEETFFVTPSRLDAADREAAVGLVAAAAGAMGLTSGPVHGEVRIPRRGDARLIEVAARTIGGLCGRALTFGLLGERLEQVVLRAALGLPTVDVSPARPASGVLMLPVPASGTLTAIDGLDDAGSVEGITAVNITIPIGTPIVALPEGDRYLGFVFATGATPGDVEDSLRRAGSKLSVAVDGEDVRPLV
jgi:biotin carboxylase